MSEARAVTNLIGNGVATVVVSKMEKEFDTEQEKRALSGHTRCHKMKKAAESEIIRYFSSLFIYSR